MGPEQQAMEVQQPAGGQLPRFGQQSIYQVARELRKEQHTLFNCLASILSDAAFIQEIRLLYPDLPLLANLRAGGWYAPSPDGTCYFKSTDGHQNNCNFSITRLNWHVAELAAQRGGVMVVDATRKGKRFPDAMSKTIPIWAAVLNRAVARVRAYDAQKAQRRRTYAAADGQVFTAVTDTQTTISVRSSEGAAAVPDGEGNSTVVAAAVAADATAACTDCRQEQQPLMPQLGITEQWQHIQQQQQAAQLAAGQHQQHGPEQPQGHSAVVSTGSCTLSIEDSIEAASAGPSCTCSSNPQVVQLLADCLGPSLDLLSGFDSSTAADEAAHNTAAGTAGAAAARADGAQPAANTAAAAAAAAALGAAGMIGSSCLAPACCCLHRSKSVHLSPQPSLHEWLDEMDVLRRLSIIAEGRPALRPSSRVSCPSGCPCLVKIEPRMLLLPDCRAAACAGSAPAVSCLLATAEDEPAPATPAAAGCARAQFVEDVSAFEVADRASSGGGCRSPAAAAASGGVGAVQGPTSAPLPAVSKAAAPVERLVPASPAFLPRLRTGAAAGQEDDLLGDPGTPRLMLGSGNSSGSSGGSSFSSGDEVVLWDPLQASVEQQPDPEAANVPVTKQLRFADEHLSDGSSDGAALRDFAFPPFSQLAASAGSSVGAEAAGHLAASGMASSGGSSCGSGLVRVPDMPVVVLNGTSHQPGDAASILDIWRGTDLEDVACLPGISDFRPGVYHMPEGAHQQQQDSSTGDAWPSAAQQSQQSILSSVCAAGGNNSSSGSKCTVSWAAEVCLRSEQQLAGRVSVSNWLEDDDTGPACEALCAFAVPAMSPSCCSTTGSTEAAGDDAPASCHSLAWSAGQGSLGSDCSVDSRPSSRQSSSTTLGFSSSGAQGGILGESSSMGSGCLAAAVDAAGVVPAAAADWDTALHLPLWVSSHEREAIEAKLDGWVERLLEIGADVRGLAAVLHKPLRPLWVSQASQIWTNQVAHPSDLPFTPLLLVSASQPHAGDRQAVKAAWLSLAKGAGSPERPLTPAALSGDSSSSSDDSSDEDAELDGVGMACGWVGSRSSSRTGGKGMLRGQHKHRRSKAASSKGKADAELSSWSYMYVPGAGDDEESWAVGLTPALFWQHCDVLLRCGPSNIRLLVKQLVQLNKSASFGGASASLAAAAVRGLAAAPTTSSSCSRRPMSPLGPGRSASSSGGSSTLHAASSVPSMLTDKHHPAPQGCGGAGGPALHVMPAAPGAFWVGSTGLAIGNLEGASAADVWRSVDAVLCCGTTMVPALQREYQAMRLAAARAPAVPAVPAVSSSAPTTSSGWIQRQQQSKDKQHAKQPAADKPLSSTFCTSSSAAHSHWVRQQQQMAVAGAADSTVAADQPALEFSKVNGAQARKPVRKGGMLSALLSKAGGSAAAAAAGSGSTTAAEAPAGPSLEHAGSDASSDASSACSSSYYSVCSEDGVAAGAGLYSSNGSSGSGSALPRLKWLPIESAKRDRSSLKQHLQESLEFVSAHLAAGHTVLLHDVEGHDNCVCLAVAVLSGCFAAMPASPADTKSDAAEPSFVGAWVPSNQQQAGLQAAQQGQGQQAPVLPVAPVSKQSVRQQLARVSGCYPLARPTRAMLKQVFNFFEERRREAV